MRRYEEIAFDGKRTCLAYNHCSWDERQTEVLLSLHPKIKIEMILKIKAICHPKIKVQTGASENKYMRHRIPLHTDTCFIKKEQKEFEKQRRKLYPFFCRVTIT
jgi:hypothetical protein